METFLQLVARDLYAKIGNDLSRTAIVFPNKRASLFFNEYLAAETDRPLWSPAYVSISELFRQLSPLKSGDPIRLVCELYKVFREETRSEETLDDFYFWGELLISDFDDVDKNLVQTLQQPARTEEHYGQLRLPRPRTRRSHPPVLPELFHRKAHGAESQIHLPLG